ncbi:MAG: hypothetical protein ACM3X6_01390 [Patescibacteria group bacterium]
MSEHIVLALVIFVFACGVIAGLVPKEQRPNARIIGRKGSVLQVEITCQDCGARRIFETEVAPHVVPCLECGVNIAPIYSPEDQRQFLVAYMEAAPEEAAAAGEPRG